METDHIFSGYAYVAAESMLSKDLTEVRAIGVRVVLFPGLLAAAIYKGLGWGFAKIVGLGVGSVAGLLIGPPDFLLQEVGRLILLPWEWVSAGIGWVAAGVFEALLDRYE